MVAAEIREGMSIAVIDRLVSDYTLSHGAISASLHYRGVPNANGLTS